MAGRFMLMCMPCRFGTLALRVRTARFFQASFSIILALLAWAVDQLDYARQFRCLLHAVLLLGLLPCSPAYYSNLQLHD